MRERARGRSLPPQAFVMEVRIKSGVQTKLRLGDRIDRSLIITRIEGVLGAGGGGYRSTAHDRVFRALL